MYVNHEPNLAWREWCGHGTIHNIHITYSAPITTHALTKVFATQQQKYENKINNKK